MYGSLQAHVLNISYSTLIGSNDYNGELTENIVLMVAIKMIGSQSSGIYECALYLM